MIGNLSQLDNAEHAIIHFGGVRLRVTGNGNIIPTFTSLDNILTQQLVAMPINNDGRENFRLSNFKTQRAFLKMETQVLDEVFNINRVIIFAKPLWTGYPG